MEQTRSARYLERRNALWAERDVEQAKIDAAYWTFTRTARGKPPSLVVPEAFARLRAIKEELHRLREEERKER